MSDPTHTLLLDGRLVAFIYAIDESKTAAVVRAGTDEQIAALADGRVEVFSRTHEELMATVAEEKADLEGFLFRVQLEGFELREGRVQPTASLQRF